MPVLKVPDFSNLSSRERILAGIGIGIVCLLVLDKAAIGPWLKNMRRINREVVMLEEEIKIKNQILSHRPAILSEAQSYSEYINLEEPKTADMASLLREVETLGSQSGVTMGEVRPAEGASSEIYQEYAIDVQFKGTLAQWIHFVYLIGSSQSLFHIERAKLERSQEGANVLQASLRLVTRVVKNNSGASGIAGEEA